MTSSSPRAASDPGRAAAAGASSTEQSASGGYVHPLSGRYASREMQHIFSQARKFATWRRLWIALAESQRELGLNISGEALRQMRAAVDDLDLDRAAELGVPVPAMT